MWCEVVNWNLEQCAVDDVIDQWRRRLLACVDADILNIIYAYKLIVRILRRYFKMF